MIDFFKNSTSTFGGCSSNSNTMDIDMKNTIYSTLVMYRTTLAQQSDCMPYMIASNKLLIDVAKLKPKNISELKSSKQL